MSPYPHAPGAENAIHSPYLPQQAGPPGPEGPAGPSSLTAKLIEEIEARQWVSFFVTSLGSVAKKITQGIFTNIFAERITFEGASELTGLKNLELGGGAFTLGSEVLVFGTPKATAISKSEVWEWLKDAFFIAFEPTAEWTVEGIKTLAPIKDSQTLLLWNASTTNNLILENEHVGIEANEKFFFSTKTNFVLKPGQYLIVQMTKVAGGLGRGWRDIAGSPALSPNTTYTAGAGLELTGTQFLIKALGVATGMLAEAAVTAAKLAENAVESAKIKAEAVTEGKLANAAVTAAKLAENAVESAKIKAEAVTEGKLANLAVTAAKIALETITKEKLAKAVQEELLTVAAFPGLSAYTSAKEETEAKPTFITLLITTKAEAVVPKIKLENDAKLVTYSWPQTTAIAQKMQLTLLVKKGGKWKATVEGSAEKIELARQVVNSV